MKRRPVPLGSRARPRAGVGVAPDLRDEQPHDRAGARHRSRSRPTANPTRARCWPTSLTIRRERRGRVRELPWLLSNLGCSAASVASTRRSSLASSCWLASHGRRSGRQRKSWRTGSSAERGLWRFRPLAARAQASRSSQSDRRRASTQLAGIAHPRINETCRHRSSGPAGVAQPRCLVALDPRMPQPSPANSLSAVRHTYRTSTGAQPTPARTLRPVLGLPLPRCSTLPSKTTHHPHHRHHPTPTPPAHAYKPTNSTTPSTTAHSCTAHFPANPGHRRG